MSIGIATPLVAAVLMVVGSAAAAQAADQTLPKKAHHAPADRAAEPDCGCCGCWQPEYVRHPEIVYEYPVDQRFTLTSEPHYRLGRTYTYIHNW